MHVKKEPRLFSVQQAIKSLGLTPIIEGGNESFISVEYEWVIYLPQDQPSTVIIGFEKWVDSHEAAKLSIQFSRIMDLIGIEVVVSPDLFE